MRLRAQGILLFLFIPLVLWLFLEQPFEPLVALVAGIVIMFGHRFLAVPFVERTIDRRCIWSGAEIAPGCGYRVISSGKERTFNAYSEPLREKAAKFFTFGQRFAWPLRIAVLGTLAYYLVAELLRVTGVEGMPSHETNALVFMGIIGLTTVTTFVAYRFVKPVPHHAKEAVRFPLPVHNVALLGIFWTLLVFAGVGIWWLVSVGYELARRM